LDRIGPYRILSASDDSGATSFIAREEGPVGFRRDVVLKIASEGDTDQPLAARELAEEATIGSRLNHPNIVRTHDFFAQGGRLVLVQEHVSGVSLAELLAALRARQERLSDPAALYIGVAVLEALAHAHAWVDPSGQRAPIVHPMLGPKVIALGRDGAVKLRGFAAISPAHDRAAEALETNGEGAQALAEQRERADVHAAGRLLWELLSGREPTGPLEPLSIIRSDLPRELGAAVGAALENTAGKRAIGCAELASWIKKVARLSGGRDELREKVTALAPPPPVDPEPTLGEVLGDSARIPLAGWTVRLAPIANKVLSGPAWSRMGTLIHAHGSRLGTLARAHGSRLGTLARAHRRASLAIAGGTAAAILSLALVLRSSHRAGDTAFRVPPAPPVYAAHLDIAPSVVRAAAEAPSPPSVPAPGVNAGDTALVDKSGQGPAPSDNREKIAALDEKSMTPGARPATPPPAAPKMAYAVPGGGSAPKAVPPPPKGFGYLTVHSSISYAFVYVHLARYGKVEKRLTVRCGKRFLSLGLPKAAGGEPTWYAPSRTVDIPCGKELEVTMMPKWIP
jgi:hypothetical protein